MTNTVNEGEPATKPAEESDRRVKNAQVQLGVSFLKDKGNDHL